VAPFRACGAPRRSSIELALLRDVAGREGGARPELELGGVAPAAPVDTERVGPSGAPGGGIPNSAGLSERDGGAPVPVDGRLFGAVGGRCEAIGGALLALADLLGGKGPLGGGGVERAVAVALLGSFLLTHFFSSGS
jgi:hypothetical protein